MTLAGQTVLVTGATGAIGQAICRALVAEGARVAIHFGRNRDAAEALLTELGGRGLCLPADLSQPDAASALWAAAEATGRLTGLVNNAGIRSEVAVDAPLVLCKNAGINRRGPLLSLTPDDWRLSFAINIDAMFHLCQAAMPHMIAQGGAAIVNTASQWGLYPAPNHIAYNVTKAAVASFTQNLARDYAPQKIRVNAVCPGEILTPMLEAGVKRSGRTIADLDKLVPFGRIGKPEEVAALIAFLASDEAAYMCGSLVEITGAQAVA